MVSDQVIVERRLEAARHGPPFCNPRAVRAALAAHFRALGLALPTIRWVPDAMEAFARASSLHEHKTYTWAVGTSDWNVHTDKIAWYPEERTALLAAWQTARLREEPHPTSGEMTDSERRQFFAQQTQWAQQWNHTLAQARSGGRSAFRAMDGDLRWLVWCPLIEAFEAGLWAYWVFIEEVLCVRRPLFHTNGGRLHSETGPAVEWPWVHGSSLYFWQGVHVNEQVVLHPETLTGPQMLNERNLEVQRIMIERFGGMGKFLRAACARELHRSPRGTLYRLDRENREEPWVFVEVTCPSTGRQYCLRVPPHTHTVEQAVAWTFDLLPESYQPRQET